MAYALNLKLPESLLAKPFSRNWGGGMVSCCKHPGVDPFVFEVVLLAGGIKCSVNLYQTNAILCSDKKGPGPKAQLSPSKVQVLAKRRQTSIRYPSVPRPCLAVIAEGDRRPGPQ